MKDLHPPPSYLTANTTHPPNCVVCYVLCVCAMCYVFVLCMCYVLCAMSYFVPLYYVYILNHVRVVSCHVNQNINRCLGPDGLVV